MAIKIERPIQHYETKIVIDTLKSIDVDGECMEHIVFNVGLTDQILRQLFLKAKPENIKNLLEERKELKNDI